MSAASPHSPGGDSDDEFEEAARRHQEAMAALLKKRQKQEAEAKARRAEKDAMEAAKIAAEKQQQEEADRRRAADEKREADALQGAKEEEEQARREEEEARQRAEMERHNKNRLETEERVRKQMEAEEAARLASERLAEEQRQARLAEENAREAARRREAADRHKRAVQLLCEDEEPHVRETILKIERDARKEIAKREDHLRFELHDELTDQKRRKELREAYEIKQQQREAEERACIRQLEIDATEKKKLLDEAHRKQLLSHLQADLSLLEGEEKISREVHSRQQQIDYETLHRAIRQELTRHESQQELINSLRGTISRLEGTITEDRRNSRDAFHQKDQRIRELEEEVAHMRDSIESISADVEGSTELHSFLKTKVVDVAEREALVVSLEKDLRELSVVLQQEFVTVKSLTRRLRLLVADTNCQVVACVSAARSELQKRQKQHARELTSSLNSALTAATAQYQGYDNNNGYHSQSRTYDDRGSSSLTDPAHLRGVLSNVNRSMMYNSSNGGGGGYGGGGVDDLWMSPSSRGGGSTSISSKPSSTRLAGQFQVILTDDLIELLNAHESEVRACSAVVSAQRQALNNNDYHNGSSPQRRHHELMGGADGRDGVVVGSATDTSWDYMVNVYHQCTGQHQPPTTTTRGKLTKGRRREGGDVIDTHHDQQQHHHPSPPLLVLLPTLVLAFLQWVAAVTHEHVSTILLANIDTCIRALRAVATVLLTTGLGLITYGMLMM